jgi:hypothetical protein
VAKAGLTETVESVLRNIQEVTEEAERIKSASLPVTKPGEKYAQQPAVFDEARYEDLLRDLTTSIDILYDLSISRRALARGEHPSFDSTSVNRRGSMEKPRLSEKPGSFDQHQFLNQPASFEKTGFKTASKPYVTQQQHILVRKPSFAASEITLVNPSFARPALSPYAGLPSRIETSALRLPNEGPPPYEAIGVPSTIRMIASLVRRKVSESVQTALASEGAEVPVLIEYANFDSTYRDTGVPPPLQRLESLAMFLQPMRAESQTNLSLLGYFEDPSQPRIGLVYDLPYALQNKMQTESGPDALAPISLLKLVQKASKSQNVANDVPLPALEHRFRMALRLTEQLHSLHSHQIAHGNINSSSVMFTTTTNESEASRLEQLRRPLWASFDLFSKCTIEGVRRAVNFNIYKHPLDEPSNSNREFAADLKYDLYGLGLVLLEVGLWTPIGDLYKQKYSLADFKLRLEKIWIPKLGAKCGSAYMRAAETCLRLSDDQNSSRLTVEGIYGILFQFLKRCCLLDDMGSSTELIPAAELMSAPASPSPFGMSDYRRGSETSLISRQLSDTSEFTRMDSWPGKTKTAGLATQRRPVPTAAAASRDHVKPRMQYGNTFPRQTAHDLKHSSTKQFQVSSTPSTKDFKRRIVLIQQRWRERAAARAASRKTDRASGVRGATKPKREEFPEVELPQHILDHWQHNMCFQLQALVEKALRGSREASSIRLLPYGETPETARPTLIVGCKSTQVVKDILKRHLKYDSSIFDVRVKKEVIRRCRKSRRDKTADNAHRAMAPLRDPDVEKAANPDYQEKPICGASIGAWRYDEHLPPVSFGGVVVVDGRPFGMSVHHMLEPEDAEDDEDEADADDDDDDDDTSSLGSSEEDDMSTVRPPSAHSSDEEHVQGDDTVGDCPGIVPGDMEEIAITQPALDDAIDLDLHAEEDEDDGDSGIDEDHLLSYRLGQVHASSGLRRTAKTHEGGFKSISQSLPQEIDWALFELLPPRIHPFNIIKGGTRYCREGDRKGNSLPIAIKSSSDLACKRVHCLGRTSGLGSGVISPTMELVKIYGRSTFSASWTVAGDFGIGGDSGAWVICNDDGGVCGHVLASRQGRTYICPMDLLLDDIKQTLGATEVSLPMFTEPDMLHSFSSRKEEMSEAISRMYLTENSEGGGVALPRSPVRSVTSRTVHPV